MATTKSCRTHDYMYDPLFIVSGPKDHIKAGIIAKMSTAKFQICPVFPSMFSDLPNYPRRQLVLRRTPPIPKYTDISAKRDKRQTQVTSHQLLGKDRPKYFDYNVVNLPNDSMPYMYQPTFKIKNVRKKPRNREWDNNKNIQTDYRESEAQTIPWEPDYKIMDSGDPEILKLDFLKWGSGLPVGEHEIEIIKRARMKRMWEKTLPPIVDAKSRKERKDIIEAMERDEWAFREQEIEEIQSLRMELLERMLTELHQKAAEITEGRMNLFIAEKEALKKRKLETLKKSTERQMRKLDMEHRGVNQFYHMVNVIDEHVQHKSELYAPIIRHGEHPKRWHLIIDEHLAKYKAQFIGVERISTIPKWLNQATYIKHDLLKLPGTRLCVRETKWTAPVLKELHEELKALRIKEKKKPCNLREKIITEYSLTSTDEVSSIGDEEEDAYQATLLLQSVLRGRASQTLIFEGRDRCRELIRELKHTHTVKMELGQQKLEERLKIREQHRNDNIHYKKLDHLKEGLSKLQGKIVGSLFDFLNKELRRLMDERRAHAMCLLNERDRQRAEAAEAGRRQKELRRRREHDEIFKQVVKVHQDTVDLYLQDIITEGMEFTCEEEATHYVRSMAEKIEDETNEVQKELNSVQVVQKEEMIANLLHHFVLPEVEKQIIRKKIKEKQRNNLKKVHEIVYNKFDKLIGPEDDDEAAKEDKPPVLEDTFSAGTAESHETFTAVITQNLSDFVEELKTGKRFSDVELEDIESDDSEHIRPLRSEARTRLPTLMQYSWQAIRERSSIVRNIKSVPSVASRRLSQYKEEHDFDAEEMTDTDLNEQVSEVTAHEISEKGEENVETIEQTEETTTEVKDEEEEQEEGEGPTLSEQISKHEIEEEIKQKQSEEKMLLKSEISVKLLEIVEEKAIEILTHQSKSRDLKDVLELTDELDLKDVADLKEIVTDVVLDLKDAKELRESKSVDKMEEQFIISEEPDKQSIEMTFEEITIDPEKKKPEKPA